MLAWSTVTVIINQANFHPHHSEPTDGVPKLLQMSQLLMVSALLHPCLHHLCLVGLTVSLLLQATIPETRDQIIQCVYVHSKLSTKVKLI